MNLSFLSRAKHIFFILIFISAAAGFRLFWLQIISHAEIKDIGEKEFKKTVKETSPRGRIYDCCGEILADSIIVWDLAVMKKEMQSPYSFCSVFSQILGKSENECLQKIKKGKNYIKIEKSLEMSVYEKLSQAFKEKSVKGILFEPHQKRIYPQETAKEVIGLANEEKGLTAAELVYDEILKGALKRKEIIKDRRGETVFTEKELETQKPSEIFLSLDSKIQFFSEEVLKNYVEKSAADLGIGIVQEVKTGKIAAMASWPQNLINLNGLEWVYEPGSTFKTIVLSAALEENVTDENDYYYCENGAWKFSPKITIRDHEPEKNLKLNEVFEKSSNIGFAKIGLKLGTEKLYLYSKSFGFGSAYGFGFPGESKGILKDLKNYKQIDTAVSSFGHSIAATPIQVINAYTAIANGGILLKPYLIEKIKSEEEEKTFSRTEIRKVISAETAKRVKNLLLGVVDRGTGRNASIIGYSVAGKTGTSNKIDPKTGKYVEKKNVTSFCGFFPASDPQYSILVVLDNPKKFHYGGETAAPAFKEIAKRIINLKNIKPDRDFNYKQALQTSYGKNISD
ncbi:MAG: penicillin-binding protein 2 [Elusimicrobia bacterium]|nr:penicillin-binding protein 2 [Elusimicrobiota bacterium]